MNKSFWGQIFGKPKSRFTYEELHHLYGVLQSNQVVTEQNRALVVETIRSMAELMIWADQNEPRMFEFFLENNVMQYLHHVLLQPANRSGDVAKQVLQTLSIIIQNVRSETGIFFLFSNNHINNIVDLAFDFDDEEVLGYYVSFLKTISLRLNRGTVQFFFDVQGAQLRFPLYTGAIRFAHQGEGMVRAAVRTLTLNVYSVADASIQDFVAAAPANGYFVDVVRYVAKQVQILDARMLEAESGTGQALSALDSQLAEVEDVLSYISDVLATVSPAAAHLLATAMWDALAAPLLLQPLCQQGARATPAAEPSGQPAGQGSSAAAASQRGGRRSTDTLQTPSGSSPTRPVRALCALYILERIFMLLLYKPFLHRVLLALLQPQHAQHGPDGSSLCTGGADAQRGAAAAGAVSSACLPTAHDSLHGTQQMPVAGASESGGAAASGKGAQPCAGSCRGELLQLVAAGPAGVVYAALRLLVAICMNKAVAPELLLLLQLLPRSKSRKLPSVAAAGPTSLNVERTALHDNGTVGQCSVCQLRQELLQPQQHGQQQQSSRRSSRPQALSSDVLRSSTTHDSVTSSLPATTANVVPLPESPALIDLDTNTDADAVVATANATANLVDGDLADALATALDITGPNVLSSSSHGNRSHDAQTSQSEPSSATAQPAAGPSTAPAAAPTPAATGLCASHASAKASGGGEDIIDALLQLQLQPALPAAAMWHASWLLSQLLPRNLGSSSLQRSFADRGSSTSVAGCSSVQEDPPTPDSARSAAGARASVAGASLGSQMTPSQSQRLATAAAAAQDALERELQEMWGEAIFPMLGLEWPSARESTLRPKLWASSDALLSGPQVYPLLQSKLANGAAPAGKGDLQLSTSARAALRSFYAVQRAVAMLQLQQLLAHGTIPVASPLPVVSDSELKRLDIQEGSQVDLTPGAAIPCVVSFAPGQERRVYFAVAGLARKSPPPPPTGAAGGTTDAASSASNRQNDNNGSVSDASATPPASASASASAAAWAATTPDAALLRSLPVAVLADPAPTKLNAGIVLSVAPLLGAEPDLDRNMAKWLHVHVRPSVRGLLRVLKTAASRKGGLLAAMRQLADGHWVLAFTDSERSGSAKTLVDQHASRLRSSYADVVGRLGIRGEHANGQHEQHQQQQQQQQ